MDPHTVVITLNGLTELDRLELEEILEHERVSSDVQFQQQPTPEGRLGEPGSLNAVIRIAEVTLPVIVAVLGVWLSQARRSWVLKDEIEIETRKGRIRRKVYVSSTSSDGAKAEVIKQLNDMAAVANSEDTAGQGSNGA